MTDTPSRAASRRLIGYIRLTYKVHEEDGQFVSTCPELGTASCGDSVDEAFRNIAEATIQYLDAIEESGERVRIFRKRNIPIYPAKPEEQQLVPAGHRDFVSSNVLPLVAAVMGGRRDTPASVL
ncbi:MAG TPA: type II toxin-antitoxin system HicB family antitoxin [Dehalococcoidia bacterium]|nr:type II toxin-antitoxin system HicB family antitoxin [Dehalococcoidia bacterium]